MFGWRASVGVLAFDDAVGVECREVVLNSQGRQFLAPFALVLRARSLSDLKELRTLSTGTIIAFVNRVTIGALGINSFLHMLAVDNSV